MNTSLSIYKYLYYFKKFDICFLLVSYFLSLFILETCTIYTDGTIISQLFIVDVSLSSHNTFIIHLFLIPVN